MGKKNMNNRYSELVKEINKVFANLLQKAIDTAETLDESITSEVANFKKLLALGESGTTYSWRDLKKEQNKERPKIVDNTVNSIYMKSLDDILIEENFTLNAPKDDEINSLKSNSTRSKHIMDDDIFNDLEDPMDLKDLKPAKSTEQFICNKCRLSFSTQRFLNSHVRVKHNNFKDYTCDHCEYTSARKDQLKSHHKYMHKDLPLSTIFLAC